MSSSSWTNYAMDTVTRTRHQRGERASLPASSEFMGETGMNRRDPNTPVSVAPPPQFPLAIRRRLSAASPSDPSRQRDNFSRRPQAPRQHSPRPHSPQSQTRHPALHVRARPANATRSTTSPGSSATTASHGTPAKRSSCSNPHPATRCNRPGPGGNTANPANGSTTASPRWAIVVDDIAFVHNMVGKVQRPRPGHLHAGDRLRPARLPRHGRAGSATGWAA